MYHHNGGGSVPSKNKGDAMPDMDGSRDIRMANGFGYERSDGKICMIRCFSCGRENWAVAVASGQCAWCGFNPNTTNTFSTDTEKKVTDAEDKASKV